MGKREERLFAQAACRAISLFLMTTTCAHEPELPRVRGSPSYLSGVGWAGLAPACCAPSCTAPGTNSLPNPAMKPPQWYSMSGFGSGSTCFAQRAVAGLGKAQGPSLSGWVCVWVCAWGGLVAHRGWGLYCVWSCLILSCVRCWAGLGWAGKRYIFFLLPPFSSPSRPPGCHFGRGPAFLHLGQLRVDITAPLERARPGVGGGLTPPLDQHPLDRCA